MDFTKFVSLISQEALFFPHIDKLGDPYEGVYPHGNREQVEDLVRRKMREVYEAEKKNGKDPRGQLLDPSPELITEWIRKEPKFSIVELLRRYTVANCWHINDYESAAMWRLYLKSNEGIAIRSTTERLRGCFLEPFGIRIGKIVYVDHRKDKIPFSDTYAPFFQKRKSYQHECELRAIIRGYPRAETLTKGLPDALEESDGLGEAGIPVKVYLPTLIERVYVAPTSPAWFKSLVEVILKDYDLPKIPVEHSDLSSISMR